ncbi:MAG: RNA polymerase sigma factor [Flavobacteriaceae bacterium]|nr:MAG: RNA polymerase sigma factor [Flavobacteriaceae bacterium]
MSRHYENTEVLLQACLKNDRRAQLEVYDRYYHAMYNTALRIVKDPATAEDILQDSFLNAFTKLETFKGEVTFGAWLKRIVINNSIYQYRKQQKMQEVPLESVLYKVEDNNGAEVGQGSTERMAQKVLETMKQLKDSYRVSLTLHFIEGYDYEEISEIMDISYGNCRTLISRAKKSLKKKLMTSDHETQ